MENKRDSKTLAIIGAGTSLNELPRDFVFFCDTFALNCSAIAPQFYNITTEIFHHSWTYAVMVDDPFAKWQYFPELYAYKASIANANAGGCAGKLFLSDKLMRVQDKTGLERVVYSEYSKSCGVLAVALKRAKLMGYERLVLIGVDYCRRNQQRYWWENDSKITNHTGNAKAVIKATSDKWIVYEGHPDDDGEVWYQLYTRQGKKTIVHPKIAPNGELVYVEKMYRTQLECANILINQLMSEGMAIFKLGNTGLLDIPALDIEHLHEI
jgi:hypothetical protein